MIKRNVLFIGGTKFIGKLLVERFIREGHQVTVFSRNKYAENGVKHIIGDREVQLDLVALQKAIGTTVYDAVYDMCAYNPTHVETLYPFLKNHTRRIIFCSTAAVYARTEVFPLKEDSILGKHSSFGDYGTSKAAAEAMYEKECLESNCALTIFRPHYILGPGDYFERHHYMISRLEQQRPIYVPGNGQAIVQFAWSGDVTQLFYEVPFKQDTKTEIVNIAGDQLVSLDGLVLMFASAANIAANLRHIDYEKYGMLEDRFYDDHFIIPNLNLILSSEKAKTKYAYMPKSIEDYLPMLFNDWESQRANYKPDYDSEKLFQQ